MPIGPALPPHLAHLSGQSSNKEEESGPAIPRSTTPEDDDDYIPALPPHLAAARQARTAGPALGPSIPGSAAGPSRSPQRSPPRPQPPVGEDDSDDDVIGPVLSGGPVVEKSAVEEFREREERWAKQREEASRPKKQERESWMLVPPSSGVLSTVDPLRKRPTTFNKASKPVDTDSSIWTETPAEKAQRIADEVAGIKRKKEPQAGSKRDEDEDELRRKRIKESEIKKSIDKHNQEQRGGSLLDQHTKNKKDGKDEPAAIWDRDRDMGVTGRLLSDQERQAKIKEARGLNDRFGHSKRGAFDI